MGGLSIPQQRHLLREHIGHTVVKHALVRRGYLTPGYSFTDKAYEWVRKQMLERDEYRLRDLGVEIISDLPRLLDVWATVPDPSIYVYRGHTPMLVNNGDGQKPVAAVSHWLLWRMRFDGLAHPFRRLNIVGHKGSFGYYMPAQETPND